MPEHITKGLMRDIQSALKDSLHIVWEAIRFVKIGFDGI